MSRDDPESRGAREGLSQTAMIAGILMIALALGLSVLLVVLPSPVRDDAVDGAVAPAGDGTTAPRANDAMRDEAPDATPAIAAEDAAPLAPYGDGPASTRTEGFVAAGNDAVFGTDTASTEAASESQPEAASAADPAGDAASQPSTATEEELAQAAEPAVDDAELARSQIASIGREIESLFEELDRRRAVKPDDAMIQEHGAHIARVASSLVALQIDLLAAHKARLDASAPGESPEGGGFILVISDAYDCTGVDAHDPLRFDTRLGEAWSATLAELVKYRKLLLEDAIKAVVLADAKLQGPERRAAARKRTEALEDIALERKVDTPADGPELPLRRFLNTGRLASERARLRELLRSAQPADAGADRSGA